MKNLRTIFFPRRCGPRFERTCVFFGDAEALGRVVNTIHCVTVPCPLHLLLSTCSCFFFFTFDCSVSGAIVVVIVVIVFVSKVLTVSMVC